MSAPPSLPRSREIAYAFGMMGWSVLINVIAVILVYLYLPPSGSGIPSFITQAAIIAGFNVISLVTSGGRLLDAIYDPLIAQYSDRSKNPKGRRIPIMLKAILPSVIFCFLVFVPLVQGESRWNILWLIITLALFYISSTSYIIPYNALLPELAHNSGDKVRLASWQSVGFVFGIGISSNTFNLATVFQDTFQISTRVHALQLAVLFMCILGGLCMMITVLFVDEKKYSRSAPSSVALLPAIKQTLGNVSFRLFLVADFSYFVAVTIITSGLLYFVKVLLGLPESIGNKLMMTMVLVSFVFYPLINFLDGRIAKKTMVLFSLALLGFIFLGIYYLGKPDFGAEKQIYTLVSLAAIPLASLNILPVAILSEIIEEHSARTGQNMEAIYFAVRYFFVKLAQTLGIALFAMLLTYGKDPGNDYGIRLNGILGFILCITAALIFTRFREKKAV